ncbi:MAG: class I SAM-dependent methyltransferase [Planctomycetota bacterium]
MIKKLVQQLPPISRLIEQRNELCRELVAMKERSAFEDGHFYSPIPNNEDITGCYANTASSDVMELPGIDLNLEQQKWWMHRLVEFYPELPFQDEPEDGLRYHFNNQVFCGADAVSLYGLMRSIQPKRIVEIGSGFSSAVMLDTNERFLDSSCHLTFIEPYPDRLHGLLTDADRQSSCIIEKRVQDVTEEPWSDLDAGDFLFIDSSHVSKCGSDVNRIYFEILPKIRPGVIVHVHDIFPHFEYPEDWLRRGRFWNESYLLRSFLQFNSQFEILFWVPLMVGANRDFFSKEMPRCCENHGGSIWFRRKPETNASANHQEA